MHLLAFCAGNTPASGLVILLHRGEVVFSAKCPGPDRPSTSLAPLLLAHVLPEVLLRLGQSAGPEVLDVEVEPLVVERPPVGDDRPSA